MKASAIARRDNAHHGSFCSSSVLAIFPNSVRRASRKASVGIRHTSFFNVFANAPYPNNQVPQQQINSISQNLLSFFPFRTQVPICSQQLKPSRLDSDQFGIKVDHYLTPRDTLKRFRYMFYQLSQIDPLSPGGAVCRVSR